MKKTFVIVSVSDRVNELNALVESIMAFSKFDEYDLCLCYQDYLKNADQIMHKERYAMILTMPERMGCNGARIHLLKYISYDIYINLDDDMRLVQWTDYNRACQKAMNADVGFVLTNWARSEKILRQKIPKMQDKFIPQIMVYQGGGMVYSNRVADLVRALPVEKTMFDDIWCITTYINGMMNYRYLGSLALHYTCQTGGMQSFMREERPKLACPEFINYRKGKRDEWLIPMDSDVNDFARFLHEENRERALKQ